MKTVARKFPNGHQILKKDRERISCDRMCGRRAVFCEYMRWAGPPKGIAFYHFCKRCWNVVDPCGTSPRQRAHEAVLG